MKLIERNSQNKDYGVGEQDVAKRTEEFRRKKEALKRRIFEEELRRVESETDQRGKELAKMLRTKDEHVYQEQVREAESQRHEDEESLQKREKEIQAKLLEERRKKTARRTEEDRLRKEEEESRRHAVEQKLQEEEARIKAEEERARQEKEAQRTAELERLRREEEAKAKAEADRQRIEEDVRQRAEQDSRNRADQERRRQEEQLRLQREEFQRRDEERRIQEEQRRIDAEQRRKDEEARRIREEEERRILEAERRQREEEELKQRLEEEARLRAEEEAQRQVEERQRQEAEAVKRRAEELQRERQAQVEKERIEKEARILDLINKAESLFTQGDLKAALVEVAKALVNDPKNVTAREMERTIKQELGTPEPKTEAQPAPKPRQSKKKKFTSPPKFADGAPKKSIFSKGLIATLACGVLILGVFLYFHYKDQLFPKAVTFAIIPWTSSANIAEETALGSSLSEEVARQFEQQPRSAMLGYSSGYALVHSMNDPARAIFSLGYPYVLQGSLTKSAIGYNLSLRLIDSVGSVYWAQTFIKSEAALPDLPAEVAGQIAKAVGMKAPGMAIPRSTSNSGAYVAYLQGLDLMRSGTQAGMQNAIAMFREAISMDENFSDAYSSAASALLSSNLRGWSTSDSILRQAKSLAETSVKASSANSHGHVVLAKILSLQKDYVAAQEHLETAMKLSPGYSELYVDRAKLLLQSGKEKQAMESFARAYELNPRDENVLQSLGYAYQITGSPTKATWYHQTAVYFTKDSTSYLVGPLADALMLDPTFSPRDRRRLGEAFERRLSQNPRSYHDMYRYARMLQVTGSVLEGSAMLERAEAVLREDLQKNAKNVDALISLGLTLTRLGKFNEAIAISKKALDLSKDDATVKYKAAQILSLQMYSEQKKKVDDKKKEEALNLVRDAVKLNYNLEEISNADFFNLYDQPEFRTAIVVATPK